MGRHKRINIDINSDVGESYGRFHVGDDEAIFPCITSCNIACGYHGGDPLTMEKTIGLALKHGVRIGAHPSYPDLSGFGRRTMQIAPDELSALIKYQVAALMGNVNAQGGKLAYVKPHGALYNSIAVNPDEASTVYGAIKALDPTLAVMGLAGSQAAQLAADLDMHFIAEAFADRRYMPDGTLMPRSKPDAVISDPKLAVDQVLSIVRKSQLECADGTTIHMTADSFCIHGDNPAARGISEALKKAIEQSDDLQLGS